MNTPNDITNTVETMLDDCAAQAAPDCARSLARVLDLLARCAATRADAIEDRLDGSIDTARKTERACEHLLAKARISA